MKYYQKSIEEIYKELNTNKTGLTFDEATKRINENGKNLLPNKKEESIIELFFSEFKNPMTIILIVTVILSFLAKEVLDACVLIIIILVDVILGTYEEYKAKKDASSLMNLIKSTSLVLRDNKQYEILSENITIGDIIILESGMKISADARLIYTKNFQVDESSLTGESISISKNIDDITNEVPLSKRKNMIFAGTNVLTGRALGVVTNIGIDTEVGKIADKVVNTKEEKSPLTIRIEKFSKQISCLILILAIIIAFILKFNNFPLSEIFLSVIALSVSAMPEGLSLALTMALTVASKKMAKKNVIVKKLNSVEALGSSTVIASDKTGTLTVNEQTAKKIVLNNGISFEISGTGYNDEGNISPSNNEYLSDAKKIAYLASINNEAKLEYENNSWVYFGDSIDIAFLSLARKLKIDKTTKILERIPYESENQYSACFYEENDQIYCTIKGSLEKVMEFSENNEFYYQQNEELSKMGYRVIALANGLVNGTTKNDIKNLEFLGLVGFIDPIREEVKQSIQECITAGIKVKMITGDHPLTAYAIGKELNLCENIEEVATSVDLEKYKNDESKFDEFIKKIKVFARVTPLDKLSIVESLKRQGEFVAVTGDGINDAPAIKSANIGIAMGSGTDVAKDTASLIVIDDNFTSIVEGIKEGRTAYSNIRKITLFLIGCGLAEVLFFILSIMFGFDMPLVAIQLLWINLVTDGLQDLALSFEKTEEDIIKEKPRSTKESIFTKELVIEILITGLSITLMVFGVWYYLMKQNVDITLSRSIILMLMVFIQNINVYNCRSEKKSIFKTKIFGNKYVNLAVILSIGIQIILAEIPFTASVLKITPLPFSLIIKLFIYSCLIIVVFEIYKLIYNSLKDKKDDY